MKINTSIGYRIAWISMSLLLAACGGGGYSGDTTPSTPPFADATGLDRFLLFPNPQAEPDKPDGPFQTNTEAYARAYYEAIDLLNDKDTLAKWKAANKFDDPGGTKVTAVFGDKRDLGYGRNMTARYDPSNGTIAFLVENYVVNPGEAYGYSPLSLEAAVAQDARWRIGINAIEFSPGPSGGASFAKFFNFNAQTGQRELMVDLDFRGAKAMPGPCITCHGGRGDRLKADGSFPLVQNSVSQAEGDVQAHLAPFEVDSLDFLNVPGFTKADQEDELKLMNLMVLCTYPSPSVDCDPSLLNAKHPKANTGQWQGTAAADLIKKAYGGDTMPSSAYKEPDIPDDWLIAGQSPLYRDVVVPACRMCHVLRGTGAQPDIDFETYEKFKTYANDRDDRIKVHVFDRGNMPLAKLVYDNFWASNGPEILATFLENQSSTLPVRDPITGAVLQPGRPIADPGPNRVVKPNVAVQLSAKASLFADTYRWSIVSGAPTATVGDPNAKETTFTATLDGIYEAQLIASRGGAQSEPATLKIVVSSSIADPASIRFDPHIVTVLQGTCAQFHKPLSEFPTLPLPPVFYRPTVDYTEIIGRINFTDIVSSPLLRKPSGNHHSGGVLAGFDTTKLPGDPSGARANYDLFVNWILNGATR